MFIPLQAWLEDRTDSAMEYTRDLFQPDEVRKLGGKGEVAAPNRRLGCGMHWGSELGGFSTYQPTRRYALTSPAIEEEPTDNLSTMWP